MHTRQILSASGLFLCALSLSAISSCDVTPPQDGVELTIFHTNDLHSHFRPVQGDPFHLGGFARLSTLLRRLREKSKDSITVDAGDWSEGTWFFNIDGGANMLQMMRLLKYDSVVLGNHDYLNGPDQIIQRIETSRETLPVLAANLNTASYSQGEKFQKLVPPYKIINTPNGIKVGIIGLTTFEFVFNDYLLPVVITNPLDIATKIAKEIRSQVDVLIVLSHNNIDYNKLLAQNVPGVDAVISGHKHVKMTQAILVKNNGRDIPVVEAADWGRYLGELKLLVTPKKFVQFKNFELHPVSSDIQEDPVVAQVVSQQVQRLNQHIHDDVDRIVAHSDVDIHKKNGTQSLMGQLMAKSYRTTTQADLALEQAFFVGTDINAGPLTLGDIHDLAPHIFNPITGKEWTVKTWTAKGSDLWLLLNFFYTINGSGSDGSSFGWLSTDNVELTWKPGTKLLDIPALKEIKINGHPLQANTLYRVALNEGVLTILQKVVEKTGLPLDLSRIQDSSIEGSQSIISFAQSLGQITVQSLIPTQNLHNTLSDLGIAPWNITWDGTTLHILIENASLQNYNSGANLICSTGLQNNILAYKTDSQKWTEFYHRPITTIQPQSSQAIEISFDHSTFEQGFIPIKCDIEWTQDTFMTNNSAEKILYNSFATKYLKAISLPQMFLHEPPHQQ